MRDFIILFVAFCIAPFVTIFCLDCLGLIEGTPKMKKEPTELNRNRFYDNCGTPNVIERRETENKGKINVLRWS